MPELFLCCFFFFFFFFQFPSTSFTLSDTYFFNCGSSISQPVDNRTFVTDSNSTILSATGIPVEDPNPPSDSLSLYQSARVFTTTSSYEFELRGNGTLVVRLHFYPFSSQGYNLFSAVFDVSVSGFQLLSNFSVQTGSSATLKEYFLKADSNKLKISFTPSANSPSSSFAFVNAIEVFSAPDDLIVDTATDANSGQDYKGLLEQALESIHRINVGGPRITPSNDTMWRTWIPDDEYLSLEQASKKAGPNQNIKYDDAGMSRVMAPPLVYGTAREMNTISGSQPMKFNITWLFRVNSSDRHLVRLHFCDIVSKAPNQLVFNVYIGGSLAYQSLDLSMIRHQLLAAPFFKDYMVEPDKAEYINISVGPKEAGKNAILNGVEIMKMHHLGDVVDESSSKKKHGILRIGLSIGGAVALMCVMVLVCLLALKCRRRKGEARAAGESVVWSHLPAHGESAYGRTTERTKGAPGSHINLGLILTFAEIQLATNNFDSNLLIGSGGFGNVYKGVLRDGRKVAVKRSKRGSSQGRNEFLAELTLLSRIHHRHLVILIGYCVEQSEMILVYEFMENGTLRDHLYGKDLPCLPWKKRLEICIGSARGIHYLHTSSAEGIIHRDVKSANILLDENYLAKVADFGLSRAAPSEHLGVSSAIKGSFGYIDPEYFKRHNLTQKSDVYSFGVVLLEVLCARPVIDLSLPREKINLAEWALQWQQKGLLMQIIDPRLAGTINPNSLRKFGETIEKCLAEYGDNRPTMGDVLWNLEYVLKLQETALHREPHEDSTVSAHESPLPYVRRVPSTSTTTTIGSDSLGITSDDCSFTTGSRVFSQLISREGR